MAVYEPGVQAISFTICGLKSVMVKGATPMFCIETGGGEAIEYFLEQIRKQQHERQGP